MVVGHSTTFRAGASSELAQWAAATGLPSILEQRRRPQGRKPGTQHDDVNPLTMTSVTGKRVLVTSLHAFVTPRMPMVPSCARETHR